MQCLYAIRQRKSEERKEGELELYVEKGTKESRQINEEGEEVRRE